jgi:ribonucleoside-triphosphate reductase (formate)
MPPSPSESFPAEAPHKAVEQRSPAAPRGVTTRTGEVAPFDGGRIRSAIERAGQASGEFGADEAELLAIQVVKVLRHRFPGDAPNIEQIQDVVEQVLITANYFVTARAYIVYREQHAKLRRGKQTLVDVVASIEDYLDRSDWRVNANANQGYSLGGLILNASGKLIANYWLSRVYPPEVDRAHRDGDLHVHDLDMLAGYCAGWSLRTLLAEGLNGVPGKIDCGPPRHLSSAVSQIVNFLGTLQNEWAGAQAFSSFDTYLAPYVRVDRLSYDEVRQSIQELVHNLNVPSRWGTQTPFTNLTFDWTCPEDLRDQAPMIGGEEVDFTYGELQSEMDMINRAYLDVAAAGDARGRIFTFPIPTYNITPDFPWYSENAEKLFALTAKYGLPYFQNFLNSELKPNMIRSMCCRLQLDLSELLKRGNGLFGSAEQTGSLGVVTLNCARMGYVYKGDEAGLLRRTDELLEIGRTSLEIKRKVIQRHMDDGLFPYTKRYLGTLRNHFSTLGVNGVNEMIRNFTDGAEDISSPGGRAFGLRYLDHIRARIAAFQTETGHMYNLEATPAEGATHRFAREDRKRYPGILQAGTDELCYYTNSTQLPVDFSDDPFEVLRHQEKLQQKYTGGTVVHLYFGEQLPSADACRRLVRRALSNFRIPYLTITPTFSVCPRHGYVAGAHQFCPICDAEIIARKRQCAPTAIMEPAE